MSGALNVFKTITANVTTTPTNVYSTPLGYSTVILLAQVANTGNGTIQISTGTANGAAYTALIANASVPSNDAINSIAGRLVLTYGQSFRVSASANGVSQLTLSLLETLVEYMTVNNGSLVSGRVPVTDYANLTADRYQFLGLTQAEPNLGPGADNSVLVITTNNTRSWGNSLTLSGNVSANYFIGNGSLLTGIFTTITNQTFQGDGSTVVFALQQSATAVSILVTVNGVTQTPDVDYLVITNILTFTTAPANADVIQVRFLSNNSVSGTYSNADVAAFLPTYTGNITAANLSATGNIQGQYILGNGAFLTGIAGGGNANTGNVTFDNINIIGTGNLHLQPDPANNLAYLDVYLTTGSDIHIAGNSENVIIGRDSGDRKSTRLNSSH